MKRIFVFTSAFAFAAALVWHVQAQVVTVGPAGTAGLYLSNTFTKTLTRDLGGGMDDGIVIDGSNAGPVFGDVVFSGTRANNLGGLLPVAANLAVVASKGPDDGLAFAAYDSDDGRAGGVLFLSGRDSLIGGGATGFFAASMDDPSDTLGIGFSTGHSTVAGNSGGIRIDTGDATNGDSGGFLFQAGTAFGNRGGFDVVAGPASLMLDGALTLNAGGGYQLGGASGLFNPLGNLSLAPSGDLLVSGNSRQESLGGTWNIQASGLVALRSNATSGFNGIEGLSQSGTDDSADWIFRSGPVADGTSGSVTVASGGASGNGDSGGVAVTTGAAPGGVRGALTLDGRDVAVNSDGAFIVNDAVRLEAQTLSSSGTASRAAGSLVFCDAGAAQVNITLDAIVPGRLYFIVKTAGANDCTVSNPAGLINGVSQIVLSSVGDGRTITCNSGLDCFAY